MTRQCTCGGIIRQHELTGEREAWTCNACGKYSAIQRRKEKAMSENDNPWKEAVLDHLASCCMDAPLDEPPYKIIGRILDWHVAVATDPLVNGGFKLAPATSVMLSAQDAAFLATRLRRLCKHFNFQPPGGSEDDAQMIGMAGSAIGLMLNGRAPDEAQQAPKDPEHVCGLQGYNGMIDPPCPGCVARRWIVRP
jgi:hypothetical protein